MREGLHGGEGEGLMSPEEFRADFNLRFAAYGEELTQQATAVDERFGRLVNHTMETMLHGGKRLRPYLCYLGYKGFGGDDEDRIADVSLATEVYHSALLVHDDVMDNDFTRHGVLNVMGRYVEEVEDEEIARSMAILAGDLLAGLTFGALLDSDRLTPDEKVRLSQEIVQLNSTECAGQQLDTLLNITPLEESRVEDVIKLYTYKTALYTYDVPLRFGALVAGASAEDMEWLSLYATNMGIAFQITDDVMGIFGDEEKTGKPIGSDIREGKKTLLVITAYQHPDPQLRHFLQSVLGKTDLRPEEVLETRQLFEDYGIRAEVEVAANDYIQAAQESLAMTNMSDAVKTRLIAMGDKLIGRSI